MTAVTRDPVTAPTPEAAAVLKAWTDPGPRPGGIPRLRQAQQRLRRDWPALAKALDVLAAANGEQPIGGAE